MKFYKQQLPSSRGSPDTTQSTRREDVHGSGVYPSSGPLPKGNAEVRVPADWNERKHHPEAVESEKIAEMAERAREGAERKIKSEVDEAYSQGHTTEKSGPVAKLIRTG